MFVFIGLMGVLLGYMFNFYLGVVGLGLIMEVLGVIVFVFFVLFGYVLIIKKDFLFMGGFLVVGLVVVFVVVIVNIFFVVLVVSLVISVVIVFIMLGFILFDISCIIYGGEINYICVIVLLYLNIYNLFMFIFYFLGVFGGDD